MKKSACFLVATLLQVACSFPSFGETAATGSGAANYFDSISKMGLSRWPKTRIPIKVFIGAGDSVKGYRAELAPLLKQAFEEWAAASGGIVSFAFVDDQQNADITCNWTDDPKQMTSTVEDGHAVLIPDAQGILRAEVLFLLSPQSSGSDKAAKRMFLHEIGHALGISGHSPAADDVMYATRDAKGRGEIISARDKNTLAALYSADLKAAPQLGTVGGGTDTIKGQSPKMEAMRLSNEAVTALNSHKPQEALAKLEEAHALDPDNTIVNTNLGSMYGNLATLASMNGNLKLADSLFLKALPVLERCPNKQSYAAMLKNYVAILRMQNRADEAAKYEAKLQQVGGAK